MDAEGNKHVMFDDIIDHRTDDTEIKLDEQYITSSNGTQCRRETTKGWEVLMKWKDGSST